MPVQASSLEDARAKPIATTPNATRTRGWGHPYGLSHSHSDTDATSHGSSYASSQTVTLKSSESNETLSSLFVAKTYGTMAGCSTPADKLDGDMIKSHGSRQDAGAFPYHTRQDSSSHTGKDVSNVVDKPSHLARSRSTWSITFMSFILSSVPYGLSTTLLYPLLGGGPVTIIWGWVVVCFLVLCVAVSLGEITSVYPVAGGVYFMTYMLSPPGCRKILAWLTGWAFVLGNIIITLSVNFGTTLFLVGCVDSIYPRNTEEAPSIGGAQIYFLFTAITLLCNTISALGNSHLAKFDTAAVVLTFVGVSAIICTALAMAQDGRHSAEYVFTHFHPISGWTPAGWAFCIGLLHAAYATSATGMIVSMCDEVREPATQVPAAMVGTVVLNFACGLLFLVPLVFVLPDVAAVASDPFGQPLPFILRSALGSALGAFALCLPVVVLGMLCGLACTTATSRCTWAFARDGAIPGSQRLGLDRVHSSLGVPLNAMMLVMAVQLFLGLVLLGNDAAFHAFSGSGVMFLTLSYIIPIGVSFVRRREALAGARFNLGVGGALCNALSIGWCLMAIPLFSMPATLPVTSSSMNYAPAVFAGGLSLSVLSYIVWGKKHYKGPKLEHDAYDIP